MKHFCYCMKQKEMRQIEMRQIKTSAHTITARALVIKN